jgi:hypothetical protein
LGALELSVRRLTAVFADGRSVVGNVALKPLRLPVQEDTMQFLRNMITNTGTARELLEFLWTQKMWWLVPMMAVLLAFGLLLVFASSSGIGAFIYTLY